MTRRGCLAGEWDDPTWIRAEATEEFEAKAAADKAQYTDKTLWLSVKETAHMLGLPADTIYRQLRRQSCPFRSTRVGGLWRILRQDVEQFLDSMEDPCVP